MVVVAEGAGEELLGQSVETDAGGNRKLLAIGVSDSIPMHTVTHKIITGAYNLRYWYLLGVFEEQDSRLLQAARKRSHG